MGMEIAAAENNSFCCRMLALSVCRESNAREAVWDEVGFCGVHQTTESHETRLATHHSRLLSPLHLAATPTLLNLAAPCNSGLPLAVSSPLSLPFPSSSSHSSSVVPAASIVVAAPLRLQSAVVVVAVAVVLRLATQNVRDYGFAGSIIVTDESMEEEGFALNLKTSRQFARTQVIAPAPAPAPAPAQPPNYVLTVV
ncbi:hypothetical protein ACLOJK_041680 [Asimina triloba]